MVERDDGKKMTQADKIRAFVINEMIIPARNRGEKTIEVNAEEIHTRMSFKENRYPNVCSAINAQKFLDLARVKLVSRTGPLQSNTAKWKFALDV